MEAVAGAWRRAGGRGGAGPWGVTLLIDAALGAPLPRSRRNLGYTYMVYLAYMRHDVSNMRGFDSYRLLTLSLAALMTLRGGPSTVYR